ncbi:protein spire homolog 1-like isoform X1 [Asterias amurensis]|uniref:protein spire homolog 1-like isoform X1 n=1 Tax=Asterias amurensis TaxID=7602 RepID=UPI003AB64501
MAELKTAEHRSENSVSLDRILSAFDGPLNEEQAWAICYQCAQFLKVSWSEDDAGTLTRGYNLEGSDDVYVHKDGSVTVSVRGVDLPRENGEEYTADITEDGLQTESEMVNSLGLIVYQALDYGCHEEEERVLSGPLESMIDHMTNMGDGEDEEEEDKKSQSSANTDEGIVDGHESDDLDENENTKSGRLSTFAEVALVCSRHLQEPSDAPCHYQAVCRAVLAEVQELTSFLQVIASSKKSLHSLHVNDDLTEEDGHLEDLQPRQWARIWMQVLQQLRRGVKLKEAEAGETRHRHRIPIEYELTPYEILMDDIRLRKFTLKEVLVNGDIPPRVKKEAHDVILDFIRSRPPLKPVQDKCRLPLRKQSAYERLMDDIRAQPELAPASQRVIPERKQKPKKKKAKPKIRTRLRHQSTSEGSCASSVDSEDLDFFEASPELPRKVLRAEITLDWSDEDDATASETSQLTLTPQTDTELLTPQARRSQLQPLRRLATINAPSFDTMLSPESSVTPTNEDVARQSDVEDETKDEEALPRGESPRRHSIAICQTSDLYSGQPERYIPPECLALTVDEVIHIRSVLVKAEIENLRVTPKIYHGVLKEKICFSCKKKFALFKRKSRCKLCKRLICMICCKKMFLPQGHFLQIPIEALSPTSPRKSSPTYGGRFAHAFKSHSEPPTPSVSPNGSPRLWRRERQTNRPKEELDNVCCECKDFLREAVRSSHQASRVNGLGHQGSEFTLDSPPRLRKQSSLDSQKSGHSNRSERSSQSRGSAGSHHSDDT